VEWTISWRQQVGYSFVDVRWHSHIDTLDPKPDQSENNRGPFSTIPTTHPGIGLCEHFPKYAKTTDKLTIIRSVDYRSSNHQPN
jgi:hypothetical protein